MKFRENPGVVCRYQSGLLLQTAQSAFFLFICQLAWGVLITSKNVWIIWMQRWVALPLRIIMGDFNANPGSEGGSLSSTPTNEQG